MLDFVALFESLENGEEPASVSPNGMEEILGELIGEVSIREEAEDFRQYLHKEECILSLLRDKKPQKDRLVALGSGSFLKDINTRKLLGDNSPSGKKVYLLTEVAKKVVRPLFQELGEQMKKKESFEFLSEEELEAFFQVFPREVMSLSPLTYLQKRLLHYCVLHKEEHNGIGITLNGQFAAVPLSADLKKSFRGTSRKLRSVSMDYTLLRDSVSFSEIAFLFLTDKLFKEYLEGRNEEDLKQDVIYQGLADVIKEKLRINRLLVGDFMMMDKELCQEYGYELSDKIERLLDVEIIVVPYDEKEKMLTRHWLGLFSLFFPEIPRYNLWAGISDVYRDTVYLEFITALCRECETHRQTMKYQRENAATAAKVFETKKGIPEKYLKAMAESKLNDVFGYVEFDADCDIDMVQEIVKEFLGFKQEFFGERTWKDHSIRFRKLGRHHASGLYFPYIRCLCVDLRTPSSLIHEYLHMLDYGDDVSNCLSSRYSFWRIRVRYEYLLREWMKTQKNDPMVKVLGGSTKYNLSYYLEPTEIFARCGEIYFRRLRGVNSSLLGSADGFDYPQDETLESMIQKYFDEFFGVVEEPAKTEDGKAASGTKEAEVA